MNNKYHDLNQKLKELKDETLLKETLSKRQVECQSVAEQIAYISEIARRKLHLKRGYKDLKNYIESELNIEGGSGVRVCLAYKAIEIPEILEFIESNKLSMTAAVAICSELTKENYLGLLSGCAGMSRDQVMDYKAKLNPLKPATDSLRKAPQKPNALKSSKKVQDTVFTGGLFESQDNEPKDSAPILGFNREELRAANSESYNIRFNAGKELKEAIERLGEILGYDKAQGNLEEILMSALQDGLDKRDPERRQIRREARDMKNQMKALKKAESNQSIDLVSSSLTKMSGLKKSMHKKISLPKKDKLLLGAGQRCKYVDPLSGRRCSVKIRLESEHIIARAKGGSDELDNLQIYCKNHNLFKAEVEFSPAYIQKKILESRQGSQKRKAYELLFQ